MKQVSISIIALFLAFHAASQVFMNSWNYRKHFPDQDKWLQFQVKGSDTSITCMKFYFISSDTIFFREFPSQEVHKLANADVVVPGSMYLGKDYAFMNAGIDLKKTRRAPLLPLGLAITSMGLTSYGVVVNGPYILLSPWVYAAPAYFLYRYQKKKTYDRYCYYYLNAPEQNFTKSVIKDTNQTFQTNPNNPVPSRGKKEITLKCGLTYAVSTYHFQSNHVLYFHVEGYAEPFKCARSEIARFHNLGDLGAPMNFNGNDLNYTAKRRTNYQIYTEAKELICP